MIMFYDVRIAKKYCKLTHKELIPKAQKRSRTCAGFALQEKYLSRTYKITKLI